MIGYTRIDGVWHIVEISCLNGNLVGRIRGRATGIPSGCGCMAVLYGCVSGDLAMEISKVRLDGGRDAEVLVVTEVGGKSLDYFGDERRRSVASVVCTLIVVGSIIALAVTLLGR